MQRPCIYEPEPAERDFWEKWDRELRDGSDGMPAGKASLWGRLLLQAAGSSPSAWLEALGKFPEPRLAQRWKTNAPMERSWERKTGEPPTADSTEGGLVDFHPVSRDAGALEETLR